MAQLTLTDRAAVLRACAEFDKLGRTAFLKKHGFRPARQYFLLLDGRPYDSKAIAGLAWGIERHGASALAPTAFSGGEKTVAHVLRSLGFTVVRGTAPASDARALVLVENEVTMGGEYDFWADDTGVQYQFPNAYKNRVLPGLPFVYYRGVRRAGGKRGSAEYFGAGVIADVWPDQSQPSHTPPPKRHWFCAIDNYIPFDKPVPAKHKGVPYEEISSALGWRTGVRLISRTILDRILEQAVDTPAPRKPTREAPTALSATEDPFLLIAQRPRSAGGRGVAPAHRRSDRSKEIGDWAEEQVFRWLQGTLPAESRDSIDWIAQRGETPGWDISYVDHPSGHLVAVEVKATVLARFSALEMTVNEWRAAQQLGERYVLALVAGVGTSSPRVSMLRNPTAWLNAGKLSLEPVGFRVLFLEGA
jgi:hypothetical protein